MNANETRDRGTSPGGREAWAHRTSELTEWVLARLVNRTDRCGGDYTTPAGETAQCTRPTKGPADDFLDARRIEAHFRTGRAADIVGVHALGPGSTGKWLAVDIDAHDETADPDANRAYATHLYEALVGF